MAMSTDARESAVLERIAAFRRRRPRLTDEIVTLAHGAGGKSSAALVDAVFLEAFANDALAPLADAAELHLGGGDRLSFSTDSFVVRPRSFPGGSIGHLAVHGTVNDVAMLGARPRWLSAAFVIEEGFAVAELRDIVADMATLVINDSCIALQSVLYVNHFVGFKLGHFQTDSAFQTFWVPFSVLSDNLLLRYIS
jgi:hydrogenase expression/formation protein HypE